MPLSRESAAQLDIAPREVTDDERGLAVLAQVLRHRELDVVAQPLADGEARGRIGVVGADERGVFVVVAEIAIGEVAALEPEGIEADGPPGDAEQVGGEQRQRGFGVRRADNLRRDLARRARAFFGR